MNRFLVAIAGLLLVMGFAAKDAAAQGTTFKGEIMDSGLNCAQSPMKGPDEVNKDKKACILYWVKYAPTKGTLVLYDAAAKKSYKLDNLEWAHTSPNTGCKAAGPGGVAFAWDGEITELRPREVIAWRSAAGSLVRNAGIIHLQESANGGTRLHIRVSYNPPGGAIGHTIAKLFGDDPKSATIEMLLRLKLLMETGKTTTQHPLRAASKTAIGGAG